MSQGAAHPPGCQRGLAPLLQKSGEMGTRGCGGPGGLNPNGTPGAPVRWPRSPGHAATRGQGYALGANGQRAGESLPWSSLDSCTARCGRGICCVACRPQLERKSLLVSAPRLATAFLHGVRSTGPAATSQRRTLRIQQGRRGRDPLDPPHLLAP